jgi:PleD family two-component response regulator
LLFPPAGRGAAATGRAADPIEMLRLADQRLYGAKRSGRDAICANDRVRAA